MNPTFFQIQSKIFSDTPRRIPRHHINQLPHSFPYSAAPLRLSYFVRPPVYVALPLITRTAHARTWAPWAIRDPETWIESKVLSLATCTVTLYTITLSLSAPPMLFGGDADIWWFAPNSPEKYRYQISPYSEDPRNPEH